MRRCLVVPRKISADIDMQILTDISLGMIYRDIAKKYNVSPSYISKLASGKKKPNIRIPEPSKILDEGFETFENDIDAIMDYITKKRVFVTDQDITKFLHSQVHKAIVRIKVYLELIKKYEGKE